MDIDSVWWIPPPLVFLAIVIFAALMTFRKEIWQWWRNYDE